jgi:outer membrane protein assembly factor BamB
VTNVAGLGPTVYIGSYDGNFYALDARSGSVRWIHHDGGRISGAPTVVGNLVYYSSLGNRDTSGLDVRTGTRYWHWPSGAFNPVISDGKRLYLTMRSNIAALIPKQAKPKPAAKPAQTKPKKKH